LLLLAGGVLLGGCSPVAADIGLRLFQGFAAGMNSSGLFELLLQSVANGV
jgi:hypothetical protein